MKFIGEKIYNRPMFLGQKRKLQPAVKQIFEARRAPEENLAEPQGLGSPKSQDQSALFSNAPRWFGITFNASSIFLGSRKAKQVLAVLVLTALIGSLSNVSIRSVLAEGEAPAEAGGVVTTGNSVSTADAGQTVNLGEALAVEGENKEPATTESGESNDTAPVDKTIKSENGATLENQAGADANSGSNAAVGFEGEAGVDTGNADAAVDLINVVNTNIIDSEGFFAILNAFSSYLGDIDLRDAGFILENDCGMSCSLLGGNLLSKASSTADITNQVIVRANTGDNLAKGDLAVINTGDASAAANVINIANTNIIGSNYLMFMFNNFENWNGDVVLPSKYTLEDLVKAKLSGSTLIKNDNTAVVGTDVITTADSGNNTASSSSSGAEITTGNSVSATNVLNQVNENIFGGNSFIMLVRVFGKWTGNIFSAPDNISWQETPEGLKLYQNGEATSTPGEGGPKGDVTIKSKNNASVQNNVKVLALTGDNRVEGNKNLSINTGKAFAVANIMNIVNTNVYGRNWILAMINIFGDWTGNIAFGRPDLWIGEMASVIPQNAAGGAEIQPGDSLTYKITVWNKGDTDATGVRLTDMFNFDLLRMEDYGGGYSDQDGKIGWDMGSIPRGGSKTVTYKVRVRDGVPMGGNRLLNSARVTSYEPDADNSNNEETVYVDATRRFITPLQIGPQGGIEQPLLKVTKIHNAPFGVRPGETVGYTLILTNEGAGSAYNVVVDDEIVLRFGGETTSMAANKWELGEVLPGEEVTMKYSIELSVDAPGGIYQNTAEANGTDGVGQKVYAPKVSTQLQVDAPLFKAP